MIFLPNTNPVHFITLLQTSAKWVVVSQVGTPVFVAMHGEEQTQFFRPERDLLSEEEKNHSLFVSFFLL